jgi:hypothetical protein
MAESPSTMDRVKYIHQLLDELVETANLQNDALTEILAAIKGVGAAVEHLESTYRGDSPLSPHIPRPAVAS